MKHNPLILISLSMLLLQSLQTECIAQIYDYPQGFAGRPNNSSFNGGFSGLSGRNQTVPQKKAPRSMSNMSPSTMAALEQQLNQVERTADWSSAPQRRPVQQQLAQQPARQQQRPQRAQPSYQRPPSYAQRTAPSYKMVPLPAPTPGTLARTWEAMFPGVSRQELLRVAIEGGTPQSAGFASGVATPPRDNSATTNTAYQNLLTASNEEAKARGEANTARNDQSQWNRRNAATRAEYDATNAEYAAQRAESAAYSGDNQAHNYAAQARGAANRARELANQARYNADTMQSSVL